MDSGHLREHFNRHAKDFDRLYHIGRQSKFGRWFNRHFHADIAARYLAAIEHVRTTGAQSVLDVGCGPGHYLAALSRLQIPRIVGIDVSEQMLHLARQNQEIAESHNIEVICADFATWESDEKFDVVLALGFFDYVANPADVLIRMREHSNSSVFASFPSRNAIRTPIRWIRRRVQGTRVYFYSEKKIDELAGLSGFSRAQIIKIPGMGMNYVATLRV